MISTNSDIFKTKTFQLKRDYTFKDCPKLTEMVKKPINSGVFLDDNVSFPEFVLS